MATPTPRPGIMEISPYVGGAAPKTAAGPTYKLASNESALGPSPKALSAYTKAQALHVYPDSGARGLREAIAALHGLDPARIVCGAGSDEILQLVTRAYAGPGDNIVQTEHGFLVYAIAAQSCSATARFAPEKNLTADVDAILSLVDEATKLVFIANPNNPTGTYIPDAQMRRLRENLRDDVILVIDAAYAEYMDAPDYDAGAALVDENDNTVMTRTFSKIYGLGGLRLGWGYFPAAIADVINRIRGPFNVSSSALAAGEAAIGDQEFVARNREHNRMQRDWLYQQLGGLGMRFQPSVGNFVLVEFPDVEGQSAEDVRRFLSANGVEVRAMGGYRLPSWLRITVGSAAANRRLIELLAEKVGDD
ncbi:MAG: histidinol-phosphate transaminase [Parvularculaceae bacterium]